MAIKTAYISKLGRNYKVSAHFTLGEIASRDGADKVLYDTELLDFLEFVRALLGGDGRATVGVNSLYRSPAHNIAVGGASKSTHTEGIAADVVFKQDGKRVPAKLICCLLQDLGIGGIAYISQYAVHVDNRKNGTYRGYEPNGYGNNVGGDFYSFFDVTKAQVEALKVNVPEEEEDEMTKDEVRSIVFEVIAELMGKKAVEPPADWSEEAREWAKSSDIVKGTNIGDEWKSPVDREQLAVILYRVMQKIDPIK